MAAPICMKRMAKERPSLEKPNPDYFVYFDDDNLRCFHAYVIGPKDSLYEHKFVKVKFDIPDQYPLVPPTCKFIQHRGDRIHPNLYVEGKICLSILGTWTGEPWALAMSIETVLITIRSLLDNEPYKHEPGQSNNPAYNRFVQYGTWTWLFLDYLKNETNEAARSFLESHVTQHSDKILADLQSQHVLYGHHGNFTTPYSGQKSGIIPNYARLKKEVTKAVEKCCSAHQQRQIQISQRKVNEIATVDDEEKQQQQQQQETLLVKPPHESESVIILDDDDDDNDANKNNDGANNNRKISSAQFASVPKRLSSSKHQTKVSIEVIDLT